MQMTDNHGFKEVRIPIMPDINAAAAARIGDETFPGVLTTAVTQVLNDLFSKNSVTASLRPAFIGVGRGNGTTAKPTDTGLADEITRFPLTQLTQSNGITTALVNVPKASENLSEGKEIGVFTRDGTLIARATEGVKIPYSNNSILNIIWMLRIDA